MPLYKQRGVVLIKKDFGGILNLSITLNYETVKYKYF